jgi:hypothetical protein
VKAGSRWRGRNHSALRGYPPSGYREYNSLLPLGTRRKPKFFRLRTGWVIARGRLPDFPETLWTPATGCLTIAEVQASPLYDEGSS